MKTDIHRKIPVLSLILIIIFHCLLLYIAYTIIVSFYPHSNPPSLLNWDSGWYNSIRLYGYFYKPDQQSSVAFFPLFPIIWHITNATTIGICILNGIIFLAGLLLFNKVFNPPLYILLIIIAIPSATFFYLPYSESLFYLSGIILLSGLKKDSLLLQHSGMLLSGLTRSATTIFIPAILLLFIFHSLKKRAFQYQYLSLLLTSLASTSIVAFINFMTTGEAFGFIKTQQHWEHFLQFPDNYFSSWGQRLVLQVDAAALICCCIAGFVVTKQFIQLIKNPAQTAFNPERVFSMLYLSGIGAFIILFQGEDLHSINRYCFASPYFAVFLLWLTGQPQFSGQYAMRIFIILSAVWLLLFQSYTVPKKFAHYTLFTLYLTSLLYIKNFRSSSLILVLIYICGIFAQAYFLKLFLENSWIG